MKACDTFCKTTAKIVPFTFCLPRTVVCNAFPWVNNKSEARMDSVVCNIFPAIEASQRRELCTSISKLVAEGKDLLLYEISSEGDLSFLSATDLCYIFPSHLFLFFPTALALWLPSSDVTNLVKQGKRMLGDGLEVSFSLGSSTASQFVEIMYEKNVVSDVQVDLTSIIQRQFTHATNVYLRGDDIVPRILIKFTSTQEAEKASSNLSSVLSECCVVKSVHLLTVAGS